MDSSIRDFVVVGAGMAGASVAWQLARDGGASAAHARVPPTWKYSTPRSRSTRRTSESRSMGMVQAQIGCSSNFCCRERLVPQTGTIGQARTTHGRASDRRARNHVHPSSASFAGAVRGRGSTTHSLP